MTATAPELQPWWVSARSIRDDVAECLERGDTDMALRLLIDGVNRIPEGADDARSPETPEQAAAIHDRLFDESAIGYLPENDVLYAAELVLPRIQQS